jgi:hypothetical protein
LVCIPPTLGLFKRADNEALMPVIEAHFGTIMRVDEDKIELLPGQQELHIGGKVVGEEDSEIFLAEITESLEGADMSGDEALYVSFSD